MGRTVHHQPTSTVTSTLPKNTGFFWAVLLISRTFLWDHRKWQRPNKTLFYLQPAPHYVLRFPSSSPTCFSFVRASHVVFSLDVSFGSDGSRREIPVNCQSDITGSEEECFHSSVAECFTTRSLTVAHLLTLFPSALLWDWLHLLEHSSQSQLTADGHMVFKNVFNFHDIQLDFIDFPIIWSLYGQATLLACS